MKRQGRKYSFLKANIAGHGYRYLWLSQRATWLEDFQIDTVLPRIDCISSSHIAYSAARVGQVLLVVVGGCWMEHMDEFGRKGLRVWHGFLWEDVDFERDEDLLVEAATFLVKLVQKYETHYREIGEKIARWATDPQALGQETWVTARWEESLSEDSTIKERVRWVIKELREPLREILPKSNLKASFPFHKDMVIPALLEILFSRSNIDSVGGGALRDLRRYSYVSVSAGTLGYEDIDISNYFLSAEAKKSTLLRSHFKIEALKHLGEKRGISTWTRTLSIIFVSIVLSICLFLEVLYLVSWKK